jgi:hypothetical protein
MKTLGRILIILLAFALVMGITYTVVNAASSSIGTPAFERGGEGLPRPQGARPPNGEGREFRGGASGLRLMLGIVKNIGIIAIIVALVVWLKAFTRKRTGDGQQMSE